MSPTSAPIRRRKLSEDVRERLLAMIESGLKPGDRLPSERELMAEYGVGRPAIREAMQSLDAMGLIVVSHGERPRVAEPSMASAFDQLGPTMRHVLAHSKPTLEHLKETRLVLEQHLASVAARRQRPDDIDRLQSVLEQQRAAGNDPERFRQLDGQFHAMIAAISANPILTSVCTAIFDWLAVFHEEAVLKRGLEELTLEEHEAILEAIASGDSARASEQMGRHLTRANARYARSHAT